MGRRQLVDASSYTVVGCVEGRAYVPPNTEGMVFGWGLEEVANGEAVAWWWLMLEVLAYGEHSPWTAEA